MVSTPKVDELEVLVALTAGVELFEVDDDTADDVLLVLVPAWLETCDGLVALVRAWVLPVRLLPLELVLLVWLDEGVVDLRAEREVRVVVFDVDEA